MLSHSIATKNMELEKIIELEKGIVLLSSRIWMSMHSSCKVCTPIAPVSQDLKILAKAYCIKNSIGRSS